MYLNFKSIIPEKTQQIMIELSQYLSNEHLWSNDFLWSINL